MSKMSRTRLAACFLLALAWAFLSIGLDLPLAESAEPVQESKWRSLQID